MFRLFPGVFAPGITYSPGVGSQGRPSLDSGHSLYCYAMGRIYKIVLQPKLFSLRSKMKLKTNAGSSCTSLILINHFFYIHTHTPFLHLYKIAMLRKMKRRRGKMAKFRNEDRWLAVCKTARQKLSRPENEQGLRKLRKINSLKL